MFTRSRLTPISADKLSPEQSEILQAIVQGPRGNLDGPFLAWIRSPQFANYAQQLGAFCRFGTRLEVRLSELAILVTASIWQSQAEWMIHQPIALKHGIAADVIDSLLLGDAPNFTKEDEALVFQFISQLYEKKRVSDRVYAKAINLWGEEGVVELTGIFGYYALVAMTLNVFNVLPDDESKMLPFSV